MIFRAADPTVNPLIGTADLAIPRTICNYTETPVIVKPLSKYFLRDFLRVWKAGESLNFDTFRGILVTPTYRVLAFFLRASAVHGGTTPTERE